MPVDRSLVRSLFESIRASSTPKTWSKGVELARADSVTTDSSTSRTDEALIFRVLSPSGGLSHVAQLFPNDEDWFCDCHTKDDVCEHVIAAAIVLKNKAERGEELPKSKKDPGKISYAFRRVDGRLVLDRFVTLEGAQPTKITRAPLESTKLDLAAEVAIALEDERNLNPKILREILAVLADSDSVTYEAKPVRSSGEPRGLIINVVDEGPGFKVFAEQDPAITEVFSNGAVLMGGTIHPLSRPILTPEETEIVSKGKFFAKQEINWLVGDVLPSLEEKFPIRVTSEKLPKKSLATPSLDIGLSGMDESLIVSPSIVYSYEGRIIGRIFEGRLILAGSDVPIRNHDLERKLRDELWQKLGLELDKKTSFTGEAALAFVDRVRDWQERSRGSVSGDAQKTFVRRPPLVPQVIIQQNDFSITFTSEEGRDRRTADVEKVFRAWKSGETLVPLLEGGLAPLPRDWLERFGDRILDLLAARRSTKENTLPRAALLSLCLLARDLGIQANSLADITTMIKSAAEDFIQIPHFDTRAFLRAQPRHYQSQGIDWLAWLRTRGLGALLADDMGLGKTIQAMAVLRAEKSPPSLIVAPTSVLPNWISELARFRPDLKICKFHGTARSIDPSSHVVVTTYALLRVDKDSLTQREWSTVILDEAQNIKNPESQVAQAAYELKASFRLALTGTPIENRLDDLWSQFNFINPGLLGSQSDFRERYASPIGSGSEAAAQRLRDMIKPFVLRRLKKDVLTELPPKTETILHVELSAEERTLYDAILLATRSSVIAKLEQGGSVMEALEALLRLRQACTHPMLVEKTVRQESSKIALLIDTLEKALACGHKALVFSQWTSLLDLLEPELNRHGIRFLRLDGSTRDRGSIVQEFQSPGGSPVLIMSLKAGGVGLNLTAADHVFLLDPWWNPATEEQASDRAHRIGQDSPVFVHRLVALDTVEEKIIELQERKRALADSALAGGSVGGRAQSLTREDLLNILSS